MGAWGDHPSITLARRILVTWPGSSAVRESSLERTSSIRKKKNPTGRSQNLEHISSSTPTSRRIYNDYAEINISMVCATKPLAW
jgi:hypothetical protein